MKQRNKQKRILLLTAMLMFAFALPTGTYCGVTFVIIWSVPMKKLKPFGWKFNTHPNDEPKLLIA